ncbi:MAG: TerB N-terminal domain-containing protein [Synergistaceae bacterium]|nr:TerB N-terminal domain-containing protein [Synergistaceae bacterium]
MLYLVIGIMLVVAVGAIMTQRTRHPEGIQAEGQAAPDGNGDAKTAGAGAPVTPEPAASSHEGAGPVIVGPSAAISTEAADSVTLTRPATGGAAPVAEAPEKAAPSMLPQEEIVPLKPMMAAEPISSPSALASATYSSVAPPELSSESPYSFVSTEEAKPKIEPSLLRWSGRAGTIQVGDLTIRGPVAYWSNGPSATPEPSCIDVALPVEFPDESALPTDGAASYAEMTPPQRGAYLMWLAGGRIQPPSHACQPTLWLFGLERRVLSDRLDISLCIGEAFRLLPLLRWDSLRQGLVKFVTWMAAKVWLPEEQLLAFCRALPTVPTEILNMLLRPYADAKLPLPSMIAFTLMRTSSLGGSSSGTFIPHSDELLGRFASLYKSKCQGGIVLSRPKTSVFVACVPVNPSLAGDKNAVGGVLELPDFFKDLTDFNPLIAVWNAFLKEALPLPPPAPVAAREEVEARPDWVVFIQNLQGSGSRGAPDSEGSEESSVPSGPAFTELGALAALMDEGREGLPEGEGGGAEGEPRKPGAADRKKIADAARVEGFLILPNLGIAGKEYHWEDSVALVPLEAGTRLSRDFNAAALLLEYSVALLSPGESSAEKPEEKAVAELRTRLDDCFSLSSDDHARLEALSDVLLRRQADPENIGECLRFWLSREQRGLVRDLLKNLLTSSPDLAEERRVALSRAICASLEVATDDPPPADLSALDLGLSTAEVLATLFKD